MDFFSGIDLIQTLWAGVIGGAAGGIGVMISRALFRGKNVKSWLPQTVTIVVAVSLFVLGRAYILPLVHDKEAFRANSAAADLEASLDESELFSMFFERHPERRQEYVDQVSVAYAKGGQNAASLAAENFGRQVIGAHIPLYIRSASQTAVLAFLDVTVEVLDHLHTVDSDACYAFLFGGGTSPSTASISEDLEKQMNDAVTAVVHEGIEGAEIPLSKDRIREAESKIVTIFQELAGDQEQTFEFFLGDFLGSDSANNTEQRKGACLFALRLYQEVGKLEDGLKADTIKIMMGQQ